MTLRKWCIVQLNMVCLIPSGADGVLFFCIDNPVSIVYSFNAMKLNSAHTRLTTGSCRDGCYKGKLRLRRRMIDRPVRD